MLWCMCSYPLTLPPESKVLILFLLQKFLENKQKSVVISSNFMPMKCNPTKSHNEDVRNMYVPGTPETT